MMFQRVAFLAGAAAIALTAVPAAAATIVDTGAPTNVGFGGWTLDPTQSLAGKVFTGTTVIDQVEGFIGSYGNAGTFHTVLYSVSNSGVPEIELYSALGSSDGSEGWHGASGLNWMVAAGSYYVAFEVRAGDTLAGYMANPVANPLISYSFSNAGTYYRQDSLQFGVRIADAGGFTGGVPEPANWALMIAGFGLAGAAMRVRRRSVAFA
jgi:hypothetical protein